ncbi:Glucan endo-1,3-beta-glucosidase [Thalictrum thalictroides]|uniref:Glucan endo-1,3-beta-glucosidase n=1 Tax=Thalictrum thalictroides TaxID=46969 RepID=A0A7J6WCN3_THATH|nr:Glucan endo-1,3-beta-glucosidase [Thalictrum thalictroides]
MSPSSKNLSFFFFIIIFFSFVLSATESTHSSIGITYNNRGTTHQIVPLLQYLKITSIRLPDSDPEIIRSFSYSGISLLLSIPNSLISQIASNQSEALRWLNHHVTPFYPRVHISSISVGNNVIEEAGEATLDSNQFDFLLSAMQNVRQALDELGIDKIKVSTTFSFLNVITTAFPPSSAEFQGNLAEYLMKPLLGFLSDTNSSFLINLHPYNLYRTDPEITIGFAIFQEHPFVFRDDLLTGVRYRNLFDMMVDSVLTAMASQGHENIPLIVTETGWPSSDETKDMDADHVYAELYIKGLVRHLKSGFGTPLRRDGVAETYLFELVDDDTKDSAQPRHHWGIMYPNMTMKYDIDFSGSVGMFDMSMMALGIWLLAVMLLW